MWNTVVILEQRYILWNFENPSSLRWVRNTHLLFVRKANPSEGIYDSMKKFLSENYTEPVKIPLSVKKKEDENELDFLKYYFL